MPRPVSNPRNPWHTRHREWLGAPPPARLEVFEEEARSIVTENRSPDVGFRWSVNPYRGCFHGCAYCYARPTHQYLDWGAGTDFERKIVVKVNAPDLLRQTFRRRSWRGETIALSGNTDCYQPLEAAYGLTRSILAVCRDHRNPVGIITKSALVRRDVDLLADLGRVAPLDVSLSIPFADAAMARAIEPWAPAPDDRFAAMRALSRAGVPVSVMIAPVIPGLNDDQVAPILVRAKECGATRASKVLLRLPAGVKEVFLPRLEEAYPQRAARVVRSLRSMRGGALNRPEFGARMRGEGARWRAVADLFEATCRRLGLNAPAPGGGPSTFCRPGSQQTLF